MDVHGHFYFHGAYHVYHHLVLVQTSRPPVRLLNPCLLVNPRTFAGHLLSSPQNYAPSLEVKHSKTSEMGDTSG